MSNSEHTLCLTLLAHLPYPILLLNLVRYLRLPVAFVFEFCIHLITQLIFECPKVALTTFIDTGAAVGARWWIGSLGGRSVGFWPLGDEDPDLLVPYFSSHLAYTYTSLAQSLNVIASTLLLIPLSYLGLSPHIKAFVYTSCFFQSVGS
jgi:hypothetical protein